MSLVICIMIFVFIVRVSIEVGYHPIPSGVLYGLAFGVGQSIQPIGLSRVALFAFVAGILCGGFLWLLGKFDTTPIIWWPIFVVGVLIPIWAQAIAGIVTHFL